MNNASFAASATLVLAMTGAAYAQQPRTMPETPVSGASAASLQTLFADWDWIGFQPPSKPGQYRVYGRHGYVTSGPEYNYMVSLIRMAGADARAGRDREALAKITAVRTLLAESSGAPRRAVVTPQ